MSDNALTFAYNLCYDVNRGEEYAKIGNAAGEYGTADFEYDRDPAPLYGGRQAALGVSRSTLREAIRILTTSGVLEIRRGKGTFVSANTVIDSADLSDIASGLDDLFEMRLMFEPDCAFLAAQRATQEEIDAICYYGEQVEKKILSGEDRTAEEQKFHESIANATHNAFVKQFMPVIFNAIKKGVIVMTRDKDVSADNLNDDRLIMDFIKKRNAEGARTAMRLHILHAMEHL